MTECTVCGGGSECSYDISCFQKIAGTLTKNEIKEHGLIVIDDNEHPPTFQTTTVDLTVGDGHYLFDGDRKTTSERKWKLLFIGDPGKMAKLNQNPSPEKYEAPNIDQGHTLVIPAYGSALVQLNEIIDTFTAANDPKNLLIVGRFDLKLQAVHQGLISQQATQIEPCYRGKLFCFIHNLSNKEISLKWGDRLATIEFSYASCFCNLETKKKIIQELKKKTKIKYSNRFCNGQGIEEIRYFYDQQRLPNDCGLVGFQNKLETDLFSEDAITKLADRVDKKMSRKAAWIPAILALIGAIVTIGTTIISTNYKRDIEELKKEYEEIVEDIEGIEKALINEAPIVPNE